MCGRFSITTDPATLAVELDAVDEASAPPTLFDPADPPRVPRYNVAPTTTVMALARDEPAESLVGDGPGTGAAETGGPGTDGPGTDGAGPVRVLRAMRWGLVPSWAKDTTKLPSLFNARVETAAEKPSFRAAVRRRHCVVPMDGWYEWVPGEPTAGGQAGPKQPFFMTPRDGTGLLMAGLWEVRTHPGRPEVRQLSCTILTTAAVGELRRVHDRMPLVVPPHALDDWLDPAVLGDPRALVDGAGAVLDEWADGIEIRPVSRAVSNSRSEGPELVRPMADEVVAPPLF